MSTNRAINEIEHGKMLAAGNTEGIWGWGTIAGQRRSQYRAMLISNAAELSPGRQVLEIGCGTGLFTEKFLESGASLTAVDISPDLIEIAQEKLPEVNFVCARFEEIPFENKFNAIIGSSVLHHLEIEEAIKHCFDLLKPGGKFAFAEPNMLNPQVFAERTFMRKHLSYVSPDETAFIRWQLKQLLQNCGFEEVSVKPFDWLHPATPKSMVNFVEKTSRFLEKTPLVKEFSGSLIISAVRP